MKRTLLLSAALVVGMFALASCQTTPAQWVKAGCIDSSVPGVPDFDYNGTANQLNNAYASEVSPGVFSEDGSCEGTPSTPGTIVRAPNAAAAVTVCDGLGITGLVNPANLGTYGYAAPSNAWTCLEAV
jgi:hypothetical protein